jgi:hypothetical protein
MPAAWTRSRRTSRDRQAGHDLGANAVPISALILGLAAASSGAEFG